MAVTPAFAAWSTPSLKGKNASDDITLPLILPPFFITAKSTASTLDICPAPTPTVSSFFTNTTEFDFTCLLTLHAKISDLISSFVGFLLCFFNCFSRSYPAWVRVLDDSCSRPVKILDQLKCGISIKYVVKRQFLSLQLSRH